MAPSIVSDHSEDDKTRRGNDANLDGSSGNKTLGTGIVSATSNYPGNLSNC